MVHLGAGIVAFISLLLLSILCTAALIGCWAIVTPEALNWELTPTGRMLRRAKYCFSAACGVILVSGATDVFVTNPKDPDSVGWIWDRHPGVLILLLILSSGLSVAASHYAFKSKGEGRWVLYIGAPGVAALSLLVAIWVGVCI